jgi:hypothetical protein
MYTPHTYLPALLMMLFSMLCWGSWANTEKIDRSWRFELFYWDYMWGIRAVRSSVRSHHGPDNSGGSGKLLSQSRSGKHSLPG